MRIVFNCLSVKNMVVPAVLISAGSHAGGLLWALKCSYSDGEILARWAVMFLDTNWTSASVCIHGHATFTIRNSPCLPHVKVCTRYWVQRYKAVDMCIGLLPIMRKLGYRMHYGEQLEFFLRPQMHLTHTLPHIIQSNYHHSSALFHVV